MECTKIITCNRRIKEQRSLYECSFSPKAEVILLPKTQESEGLIREITEAKDEEISLKKHIHRMELISCTCQYTEEGVRTVKDTQVKEFPGQ